MSTASTTLSPPEVPIPAVIIQQGKLLDFIDGHTQREETPEEYVRQEIAKSLVREYGYAKKNISVEFMIKLGSRKPRADLVVFREGKEHIEENAFIIVECKAQTVKATDRKEGVDQLHSYMYACPNALYGMWTNGLERFCFRKVQKDGRYQAEEIPDIPAFGQSEEEAECSLSQYLIPKRGKILTIA